MAFTDQGDIFELDFKKQDLTFDQKLLLISTVLSVDYMLCESSI